MCGFLWTSVVILCALVLCAHTFSVQHHLVSGHLNPWTKLFTLFPTSVVSENNQIGELGSQGHLCCWTQQKPSELLLTRDCRSHRWHLWGCMSMVGVAKTKAILFTKKCLCCPDWEASPSGALVPASLMYLLDCLFPPWLEKFRVLSGECSVGFWCTLLGWLKLFFKGLVDWYLLCVYFWW